MLENTKSGNVSEGERRVNEGYRGVAASLSEAVYTRV
jgi:hypothetical protein